MKTIEEQRALHRAHYYKYRDRHLKEMSDYKKRNRAKLNAYFRQKNASDMSFRIANRYRAKMNGLIYGKNKDFTALKYFGCTRAEFMRHLESQFADGMTWDNRKVDGWHVDHIVPVCSFDMTIHEQAAKCWHYTNMRPVWAKENQSKNRYGNNPNPK
jgi:hypothetical protein